jgi:hypothetical protein
MSVVSATLLLCVVLAGPAAALSGGAVSAGSQAVLQGSEERHREVRGSFGRLPLSFTENQGQADTRIAFYIQSPGHSLYFTQDGHTLRLSQGKGEDARAHTIKVELLGAAAERIEGLERAPGIVSYFKGPKDQWRTAIPTHTKIGYVQPWPGIDLAYDGPDGRLESIYTVAPHADPAQIRLRYSGQDSLRLDAHGNLVYTTSLGEITETAPVLYQVIEGRRILVAGRYILLDKSTVGFHVAQYDPAHALVIDPTLAYAGYIGGSNFDKGYGIAVDSAGSAYVTGYTESLEGTFPVKVGPDLTHNGGGPDAFVAKVNAAGTALVYAGYIGGSAGDYGFAIAVDSAGNAYVTGTTLSTEATFPVTVGPDLTHNGYYDAFVAKVNPAGTALVYCGYIGGSNEEAGYGIAVDTSGNAYVTGYTYSDQATFPVAVGPSLIYSGEGDVFVAKVNAAGTALVYAGYIGGSASDKATGIAVDSARNAYVTGSTQSTEASFPVTVGPDLTHNGGGNDAFVAKVNAAGTALVYAGYIGGIGDDQANGIAVDSAGNAYVTGYTESTEATFPVTVGPDLTHNGGRYDAFVAKVNAAGTALVYAGYIGGDGFDQAYGIAVDSAGNAYVAGGTTSTEATFPVLDGPDLTFNGAFDAFVAKVNAAGTALVYAGYIGGSGNDQATAIAVDSAGNAYVTGHTSSDQTSFPVTVGPALIYGGAIDAFVAKIGTAGAVVGVQGSVAVGGAPVVGTKVQLKNLATAVKAKTTTDPAGAYQFDPVASGSYSITIGTFVVGASATLSGNLKVKGAPSVGTKLKIKNKNTGVVSKTTTDASGNFSLPGAAPGAYKITISPVPVP